MTRRKSRAATSPPPASKARGPRTRPSGATTISGCCSSTITSWCNRLPGPTSGPRSTPIPKDMAPDARDPSKKVPTIMTTADMALKRDPEYRKISEKFLNDQAALDDAFARAWFKLCHRDMGPKVRYLGPEVPERNADLAGSRARRNDPFGCRSGPLQGRDPSDRASACANWSRQRGPRPRPTAIRTIAAGPTARASGWNRSAAGRSMTLRNWARCSIPSNSIRGDLSMADAIVLAGSAAVEKAAQDAGFDVTVPFMGGRGDATEEHTDAASFEPLEPFADGFRNYLKTKASVKNRGNADRPGTSARPVDPRNDRAGRRASRAGSGEQTCPPRLQDRRADREPGQAHPPISSATCSTWA